MLRPHILYFLVYGRNFQKKMSGVGKKIKINCPTFIFFLVNGQKSKKKMLGVRIKECVKILMKCCIPLYFTTDEQMFDLTGEPNVFCLHFYFLY